MTKFPLWWYHNTLAPNLFWKHPFGLLTVVFLFSVVCRSEEVNSPSTVSTLPVTAGLILLWLDKNLLLLLPEFVVVVASTCTKFSLEALPGQ